MSVSPPPLEVELGAPKIDMPKYHNVLKREKRIALRLNAAKNTDYIEKWFK